LGGNASGNAGGATYRRNPFQALCFFVSSSCLSDRVKFKIKNKSEILPRIEYHREEVSQYTSHDPDDEYQAQDYSASFDNSR